MKIAVIGTGIAGLGAAHALGRLHEVELFEAAERAGGHAHTVAHDSLELDTGFIVHNQPQLPLAHTLVQTSSASRRNPP